MSQSTGTTRGPDPWDTRAPWRRWRASLWLWDSLYLILAKHYLETSKEGCRWSRYWGLSQLEVDGTLGELHSLWNACPNMLTGSLYSFIVQDQSVWIFWRDNPSSGPPSRTLSPLASPRPGSFLLWTLMNPDRYLLILHILSVRSESSNTPYLRPLASQSQHSNLKFTLRCTLVAGTNK